MKRLGTPESLNHLRYFVPLILMIGAAVAVGWIRLLPLSLVNDRAERSARAKAHAQMVAASFVDQGLSPSGKSERQIDEWIGAHRAWFDNQRRAAAARLESDLTYSGDDGKRHVYLGDFDSYHWLRMARNYLRSGTTCDDGTGSECRDTYTNAPVGRQNIYARSLHISAIVLVNDIVTKFRPGYPLAASSFLVPVILGIIGVFPAFAIGRALAGNIGGLFAALLIALNPLLLQRTIGSDDDIWNIVLPLIMVWALLVAVQSRGTSRRIAYSVIAAIFAGLHAATWQGWIYVYMVALAGLAIAAMIELARYVLTGRSRESADALAGTITVSIVFYAATGLMTFPFGHEGFTQPLAIAWGLAKRWFVAQANSPPQDPAWPQALVTVAELAPMKIHEIVAAVGGNVYFLIAYAGLLVLFLPKRTPSKRHCLPLISGALIVLCLEASKASVPLWLSMSLFTMPLSAAIILTMFFGTAIDDSERSAGLILTVWFLSALYLAHGGPRYAMLLVPSFGIAAGVFVGRLYDWLMTLVRQFFPIGIGFTRSALAFALCALVIPAVVNGYDTARDYEPSMNSAWWEALSRLKAESAPNAIVYTSWDYGYWAKFVAERRVCADGGSLLTHIPFWFSQALIAPTGREAIGLFRMLSCGSDATPLPQGDQGAYGKLVRHGISGLAARKALFHVASLDRDAAAVYLSQLGLNQTAVDDVLISTHCTTPPPAYLILSSTMPRSAGLWYSEPSYFQSEYSAGDSHQIAKPEMNTLARATTKNMQLAPDISYRTAQSVHVGSNGYSMDRWRSCSQASESELLCRLDMPINDEETIELAMLNVADPQQSRLRVHVKKSSGGPARERERMPAIIWLVEPDNIRKLQLSSDEPAVGIMLDVAKHRILAGPPYLIESTFTDLMFLDGRDSKAFQKIDERSGPHGEQVTTWKLDWNHN